MSEFATDRQAIRQKAFEKFTGNSTEAGLSVRQAANAAYVKADHNTAAGRLVQGQVDHTLSVGHRVSATDADFGLMEQRFRSASDSLDATALFQLDKCVVCARKCNHGEFGVDHIGFYFEGDVEKKTQKVRSIPRIWCTPCAKTRAKQQGKPYLKSREISPWMAEWEKFVEGTREPEPLSDGLPRLGFVSEINSISGGDDDDVAGKENAAAAAAGGEDSVKPKNKATRLAWKWIRHQLAGAPKAQQEGKFKFCVTSADVSGDIDEAGGVFLFSVRVGYSAKTALVSGEPVDGVGHTVVQIEGKLGSGGAVRRVSEGGRCEIAEKSQQAGGGDTIDAMMNKTDVAAKIWLKKALPDLVWKPLESLEDKVSSLAAPAP